MRSLSRNKQPIYHFFSAFESIFLIESIRESGIDADITIDDFFIKNLSTFETRTVHVDLTKLSLELNLFISKLRVSKKVTLVSKSNQFKVTNFKSINGLYSHCFACFREMLFTALMDPFSVCFLSTETVICT